MVVEYTNLLKLIVAGFHEKYNNLGVIKRITAWFGKLISGVNSQYIKLAEAKQQYIASELGKKHIQNLSLVGDKLLSLRLSALPNHEPFADVDNLLLEQILKLSEKSDFFKDLPLMSDGLILSIISKFIPMLIEKNDTYKLMTVCAKEALLAVGIKPIRKLIFGLANEIINSLKDPNPIEYNGKSRHPWLFAGYGIAKLYKDNCLPFILSSISLEGLLSLPVPEIILSLRTEPHIAREKQRKEYWEEIKRSEALLSSSVKRREQALFGQIESRQIKKHDFHLLYFLLAHSMAGIRSLTVLNNAKEICGLFVNKFYQKLYKKISRTKEMDVLLVKNFWPTISDFAQYTGQKEAIFKSKEPPEKDDEMQKAIAFIKQAMFKDYLIKLGINADDIKTFNDMITGIEKQKDASKLLFIKTIEFLREKFPTEMRGFNPYINFAESKDQESNPHALADILQSYGLEFSEFINDIGQEFISDLCDLLKGEKTEDEINRKCETYINLLVEDIRANSDDFIVENEEDVYDMSWVTSPHLRVAAQELAKYINNKDNNDRSHEILKQKLYLPVYYLSKQILPGSHTGILSIGVGDLIADLAYSLKHQNSQRLVVSQFRVLYDLLESLSYPCLALVKEWITLCIKQQDDQALTNQDLKNISITVAKIARHIVLLKPLTAPNIKWGNLGLVSASIRQTVNITELYYNDFMRFCLSDILEKYLASPDPKAFAKFHLGLVRGASCDETPNMEKHFHILFNSLKIIENLYKKIASITVDSKSLRNWYLFNQSNFNFVVAGDKFWVAIKDQDTKDTAEFIFDHKLKSHDVFYALDYLKSNAQDLYYIRYNGEISQRISIVRYNAPLVKALNKLANIIYSKLEIMQELGDERSLIPYDNRQLIPIKPSTPRQDKITWANPVVSERLFALSVPRNMPATTASSQPPKSAEVIPRFIHGSEVLAKSIKSGSRQVGSKLRLVGKLGLTGGGAPAGALLYSSRKKPMLEDKRSPAAPELRQENNRDESSNSNKYIALAAFLALLLCTSFALGIHFHYLSLCAGLILLSITILSILAFVFVFKVKDYISNIFIPRDPDSLLESSHFGSGLNNSPGHTVGAQDGVSPAQSLRI